MNSNYVEVIVHRILQQLCQSVTLVAGTIKVYLTNYRVLQRFYLTTIIM